MSDDLRCRECGDFIPWRGYGRPREVCDACRPDWWPPLVSDDAKEVRSPVFEPSLPGLGTTTAPRFRHDDPQTSRTAISPEHGKSAEAAVLSVLQAIHEPLTDDEIAERLPDWYDRTLCSARVRLTKAGVVMPSGMGKSRRNRPASKWALVAMEAEAS